MLYHKKCGDSEVTVLCKIRIWRDSSDIIIKLLLTYIYLESIRNKMIQNLKSHNSIGSE